MDVKKIRFFFNFGKVLAVTPSNLNNRKRRWSQKLYFFVLVVLYTGGVISSQFFRNYSKSKACEMALKYFKDIIRHCHTFYILGPLTLTKRHHWFKLIRILQKNDVPGPNSNFSWGFLAWHCLFITIIVIWTRLCFLLLGLKFLHMYFIEYFQLYFQMFFMFFACVLLEMFRKRYELKKIELDQMTQKSHLFQFKVDIFRLAAGIETFNKIFGPMIILNIFYISDMFLLYINGLMKTRKHTLSSEVYFLLLLYRIGVIVFYWFHVVAMAVLADSISKQYEEIIHLANKLQLISRFETKIQRRNVEDFAKFVRKKQPEINAADFFVLKRSTIFNILNFVTYFLVVIIQFK
ncbi:uncharacterized protein LOC123009182 [Tribolium madens]|uniref:uncharacterized protein LOC123009182 n=1 Tax=Tribolium madens TaxID=41895 RepID=UPI001CF71E36|nr:uncharacterized protein LOC123009182 [Tribolium madens]